MSEATRDIDIFNRYIKPREGAVWDEQMMEVHVLSENDPRIAEMDKIYDVWNEF